jgi:hypothetical protein
VNTNSPAAKGIYRAEPASRRFQYMMMTIQWKTLYGEGALMVGTVLTYLGIRMGMEPPTAAVQAVIAAAVTIAGVALLGMSLQTMKNKKPVSEIETAHD